MRGIFLTMALMTLLMTMNGCKKPDPMLKKKSTPISQYCATSNASYYANCFCGRKTASGERYDPKKLTAAHRTLPFGTMVKVTSLCSGKSVIVRINDRGPFKKSRIIDLSYRAAQKISLINMGIGKVKLETLH